MIEKSFSKLRSYCEQKDFLGYDPYDVLKSPLKLEKWGKWPGILAIQLFKRNPVNLRPLIGIKKGKNPKALGLFLHAYSQLPASKENEGICRELFNYLLQIRNRNYSGLCWGYNFPWASPEKFLPENSPTSVVNGFIARGIFAYYEKYNDPQAVEALKQILIFTEEHLHHTTLPNGIAISYSTVKPDFCYNASLLGAEIYAFNYHIEKKEEYRKLALEAVEAVLKKQKREGYWKYSCNLKTRSERNQIDFHQGYVIDSIQLIKQYCEVSENDWEDAVKQGIDFYYNEQFLENGQALFRLPKKFPADIHQQAQGILTAIRYYKAGGGRIFLEKSLQIAVFTINNMQQKSGAFSYRKHQLFTDKTVYMRWGQAWMYLALTELSLALAGINSLNGVIAQTEKGGIK